MQCNIEVFSDAVILQLFVENLRRKLRLTEMNLFDGLFCNGTLQRKFRQTRSTKRCAAGRASSYKHWALDVWILV